MVQSFYPIQGNDTKKNFNYLEYRSEHCSSFQTLLI